MARLAIELLGSFQVTLDGEPLTGFEDDKVRALLAYLAVESDRPHRRESLAALLWPERPEGNAGRSLNQALYTLRRALKDRERIAPLIDGSRRTVQFRPSGDSWLDVSEFEGLLSAVEQHDHADLHDCDECVERLSHAVALYRGSFVEGMAARGCPEFEEWCLAQRERLHRRALGALQRLGAGLERRGDLEAGLRVARRQLELDPWMEGAHRLVMRLLALSGQRAAAVRQYETCRQILAHELGIEPSAETTRLYEQIRDGEVAPQRQKGTILPVPATVTPPPPPVPPTVPDSAPAALAGERRLVTVLHAEVGESAALLDEVGPERWTATLNDVLQILSSTIDRYGGEVHERHGDGLVALFGVPTAHEDDAERAILAALAMQEQMASYIGERRTPHVALCLGVDSGELLITVANDRQQATGRPLTLAERAKANAEPGTVLVSEHTYHLAAPLFEWQALGEIAIKGAREPLAVYCPLARKAISGKGRGIAGMESPLVGRDAELGVLREALERLRAGVGGIVTIGGEAGIGKSRLVAELRKRTLAKVSDPSQGYPVRWAEGRCLSYGGSIAYLLWLDMLRSILGMSIEDSPVAVRDELRGLVQALCPDQLDDVYPYLGQLLSLPLESEDEARIGDLEGEKLKAGTLRAVQTLIERAASERPLVLVCEDLHWADPSSIELLDQLLPLTDRASLLFICVFRPAREHASWQLRETAARRYPHRHTGLWLDPLSAAESGTLVSNLLGVEGLPETLKSRILGQAEGNPFYVEEVIRSLVDRGAIVQDEASGRWQVTEDVSSISIPDTLHGILMARIDRLHEEARRVLQLAAVIGRIFLYRILAAISEEERELDEQLTALQREEMIRERARLPELEYIFKHELTREAAYGGLLKQQRRGFHLQVGEALERLFPERVEEQLGLLAHHFTQAEAWEKAFHYLTRSGHRARRAYANREAIAYYTQALEVSGRITPPPNEARLLPVYEGRGVIFRLMRKLDEAIADFQMMRQVATVSGNQQKEGESLFNLATVHYWKASDQEISMAEQYGQEAVRLAQLTGDQRTVAGSLTSLGLVDQTRGELQEAERKFGESLLISRREGYKDFISVNLRWLGADAGFLGEYERAVAFLTEGLAVSRDISDGLGELVCLAFLSLAQVHLGKYGEAFTTIQEEMAKAEALGNEFFIARMPNHLGWIHRLFGDFSGAEALDRESAELGRPVTMPYAEISALINLGADYLGLGQCERARSHLEEVLDRIETGEYGAHRILWAPRLRNVLAEACLAMGDHEEALRYVEEGLSVAVDSSLQKRMAEGWALRGRILAYLGKAEPAGEDLQRAFALAERLHSPLLLYPIAFDLGRWYEAAGQERQAAELYGKAKATVERMATAMEDEALRSIFLQWAPVQAIYESFARTS